MNALDINCRHAQYFGSEAWVDCGRAAEDLLAHAEDILVHYDALLPYFMLVQNNHCSDDVFQFLDSNLRRFVERLDLGTRVLHIVADHGSLVGASTSTQLGRWEVANHVSLLFAPNHPITSSRTSGGAT